MGCPIFAKLPTPLVLFCPILLDPPTQRAEAGCYPKKKMDGKTLQIQKI